jgi:putative ATPase
VQEALQTRAEPVPLWIRNAPTKLMKDVGYGAGYRYAHDEDEGVSGMGLPAERLAGRRFYRSGERGAERELAERLAAARLVRERKKTQ